MTQTVQFRCPVTPRRMFAEFQQGKFHIDRSDNTIRVACDDCRRARRKQGEHCRLVVHVFNLFGECVDTQITGS